jgi:hypothetical protein
METADEIYDHISDACGDMAHDQNQMYEEGWLDIDSTEKINKLKKEGVTDIVGCLADTYYQDPNMMLDLIGDRVCDASRGDEGKMIIMLKELIKIGHGAVREACGRMIKRLKKD